MPFLDVGSFTEPKVSLGHFREWAGEIAGAYLNSGVAPTDTLCKIAQAEELTPHQVEVLAGEANKAIHQEKYASTADKYMAAAFPLADARAAIERLKLSGEVKLAAVMPDPEPAYEFDPFKAFGVEPETMDKTAEVKGDFRHAEIKLASLKEKLAEQLFLDKAALDTAERSFIKQARQMVLSADSSAERMQVLGNLDHFVKTAGMPGGRPMLAKLAVVLWKEGMLTPRQAEVAMTYLTDKTADCKAPQEMISDDLPARVVNGTHPLYITLKTFHDNVARMDHTRGRSVVVDDRLQILREKMRAL